MPTDDRRLAILTEDEIVALYEPPVFQDEERETFFDLNPVEQAALADHNINSRIYCIFLTCKKWAVHCLNT